VSSGLSRVRVLKALEYDVTNVGNVRMLGICNPNVKHASNPGPSSFFNS